MTVTRSAVVVWTSRQPRLLLLSSHSLNLLVLLLNVNRLSVYLESKKTQ
jgi:hypothetical protein